MDTTATHTGKGPTGSVAALFGRVREALEQRRVYTRTYRGLSALSNAQLADLGIHPSMIRRISLEAAYGRAVDAAR